jgi:fatty-acyl-CoA synthase
MAGLATPWVDGLTIGDVLRRTAGSFPERDAVVFPWLQTQDRRLPADAAGNSGFRLSYRQFDDEVDRVARALLALGIQKGEHVAVWATNWPRWVLLQYATARIGAVMVTVNPAYRSTELAYVLKQSDAVALFLVERYRSSDYFGMVSDAVPELRHRCVPLFQLKRGIPPGDFATPGTSELSSTGPCGMNSTLRCEAYPRLRHVVSMRANAADGMWTWNDFLALGDGIGGEQLADRGAQLRPGDAINIQYTSGTTGFPKGATLTHRNLLLNAYHIGACQKITEGDRICVPVPFYHCFGCVLGVLCCGVYGAAMIVPAEYFNAEATLAAIERERATAVYGVPTMFIAQLEHRTFKTRDLSSLRTGIMAGSPCPIEVMKRVVDEMGATQITIAYGLTEASPVITQTRTDDPLELRVSTVGRPIPDVEVKIVDPETGQTLGDDRQGELCARGHVVMLGYYNMPGQTAAAIDGDGWLHSGDLALRLPNGYYKITGRIKDMICRGGENIYPREIEEFLFTHPKIEDVAVFGVPDPKYVEEVAAWIKLKAGETATEEEIRDFCRSHLAHFKVPKHIRFVTEFPQTVTGKIQKFRMRELTAAELGLAEHATA